MLDLPKMTFVALQLVKNKRRYWHGPHMRDVTFPIPIFFADFCRYKTLSDNANKILLLEDGFFLLRIYHAQ